MDVASLEQHEVDRPDKRQFGLKLVFATTTFVALQLGLIRLLGPIMIPIAVHSSATVAILAWTRGRTASAATIGFSVGILLATGLTSGIPSIRAKVYVALFLSTLCSWVVAALKGFRHRDPICIVAMVGAVVWVKWMLS